MQWEIDVRESAEQIAAFKLPGSIEQAVIEDMMRAIVAKRLSYAEIVGCTWHAEHGRLSHLDVQRLDGGQTLECGGSGPVYVYARRV